MMAEMTDETNISKVSRALFPVSLNDVYKACVGLRILSHRMVDWQHSKLILLCPLTTLVVLISTPARTHNRRLAIEASRTVPKMVWEQRVYESVSLLPGVCGARDFLAPCVDHNKHVSERNDPEPYLVEAEVVRDQGQQK